MNRSTFIPRFSPLYFTSLMTYHSFVLFSVGQCIWRSEPAGMIFTRRHLKAILRIPTILGEDLTCAWGAATFPELVRPSHMSINECVWVKMCICVLMGYCGYTHLCDVVAVVSFVFDIFDTKYILYSSPAHISCDTINFLFQFSSTSNSSYIFPVFLHIVIFSYDAWVAWMPARAELACSSGWVSYQRGSGSPWDRVCSLGLWHGQGSRLAWKIVIGRSECRWIFHIFGGDDDRI